MSAYVFDGYWEDIGTIESFYNANIDLASINPDFNLYLETIPIFTNRRDLPPSKINYSTISQSLAAEGSIITNANISNSIVGIRTIIETGANLDGVICMGADYYEAAAQKKENQAAGVPNIGIGRGCIIKRAIIDKDARIGDNCSIGIDPLPRPDYGHGELVHPYRDRGDSQGNHPRPGHRDLSPRRPSVSRWKKGFPPCASGGTGCSPPGRRCPNGCEGPRP